MRTAPRRVPVLLLAAALPALLPVLLAGCAGDLPKKPLPAYTLGYYLLPAQTTINEISVLQGSMVNLAVGVTSLSDVPLAVRLAADNRPGTPATLSPRLSAEYVAIRPGESVLLSAVYYVGSNLPPGNYMLGLRGELREAVPDRAELSRSFRLTVTADASAADQEAAR